VAEFPSEFFQKEALERCAIETSLLYDSALDIEKVWEIVVRSINKIVAPFLDPKGKGNKVAVGYL
jgi:hypothetical protein